MLLLLLKDLLRLFLWSVELIYGELRLRFKRDLNGMNLLMMGFFGRCDGFLRGGERFGKGFDLVGKLELGFMLKDIWGYWGSLKDIDVFGFTFGGTVIGSLF